MMLLLGGCFQVVKDRSSEPRGSGVDHREQQSDTLNVDLFSVLEAAGKKNDSLDVRISSPSGVEIEKAELQGDSIIITSKDRQRLVVAKSDVVFEYAYGVGKRPTIAIRAYAPRPQYVVYCHDDKQKLRYFRF
jgi:hypothetical protein